MYVSWIYKVILIKANTSLLIYDTSKLTVAKQN